MYYFLTGTIDLSTNIKKTCLFMLIINKDLASLNVINTSAGICWIPHQAGGHLSHLSWGNSLWVKELAVIALWLTVPHWETSQHAERHLSWSVNKSDGMCCDMRWWTEQCCQRLSFSSDADLSRQILFTPHLAIISAHWVYIVAACKL